MRALGDSAKHKGEKEGGPEYLGAQSVDVRSLHAPILPGRGLEFQPVKGYFIRANRSWAATAASDCG